MKSRRLLPTDQINEGLTQKKTLRITATLSNNKTSIIRLCEEAEMTETEIQEIIFETLQSIF